jgi:hypothetical protein
MRGDLYISDYSSADIIMTEAYLTYKEPQLAASNSSPAYERLAFRQLRRLGRICSLEEEHSLHDEAPLSSQCLPC